MMENVQSVDFLANGIDGWHIKVGQVLSNPFFEYHIMVTKIEKYENSLENSKIYYQRVDPNDYNRVLGKDIEWCCAWWLNNEWDPETMLDD